MGNFLEKYHDLKEFLDMHMLDAATVDKGLEHYHNNLEPRIVMTRSLWNDIVAWQDEERRCGKLPGTIS